MFSEYRACSAAHRLHSVLEDSLRGGRPKLVGLLWSDGPGSQWVCWFLLLLFIVSESRFLTGTLLLRVGSSLVGLLASVSLSC